MLLLPIELGDVSPGNSMYLKLISFYRDMPEPEQSGKNGSALGLKKEKRNALLSRCFV